MEYRIPSYPRRAGRFWFRQSHIRVPPEGPPGQRPRGLYCRYQRCSRCGAGGRLLPLRDEDGLRPVREQHQQIPVQRQGAPGGF